MIRSFADDPIDRDDLDAMLELARRAPAAGNTAAIDFLVLDTPTTVARYWSVTMTEQLRRTFRWKGLLSAPALIVLATRPAAYLERYSEPDKARPGLGGRLDAWAQPFWWVDAGMVAQNLLLLATDRGLGASLFGLFEHEASVKNEFGVPDDRRLVCTVALGAPGDQDEPGRSAGRARPPIDTIIHRSDWSAADP
jgi:nitroreductase